MPDKVKEKPDTIDLSQLTEEQLWVAEQFSHMVGNVLEDVEKAVTHEGQLASLKRGLNRIMYDTRNTLLRSLPLPYGFGK